MYRRPEKTYGICMTEADNPQHPHQAQAKNRNIQFLRGLAIVLVLFAHGSVILVGEQAQGWDRLMQHVLPGVGVDLFFIISGFLMGATFLRKQDGFELRAVYRFYCKRIRRVLAPTWFWAAAVLLLALVEQGSGIGPYGFDLLIGVATSAAFFMANVFNGLHESDFGYFWSIALEVQFYLFFPLLLTLRRFFWPAVAAIILWFSAANPFEPAWLFRVNGLFIGLALWKLSTLAAFDEVQEQIRSLGTGRKALVALIAVLAAAVLGSSLEPLESFRWTAVALILALCFTLVAFSEDVVFGVLSRPLEAIGNVSFSLYLCHIPVWLLTMAYAGHLPTLTRVPLCLGLSLLAAWLSFRYIEQPLTSAAQPKASPAQAACVETGRR